MLSCWQNIEWYHIFVYPHVCPQGLPHNRCCHPVSRFLVFLCSVHQSDLLNHFGMLCTQRNLLPNHHVLPLDSNKFSVNWVCFFCLMHARTESHLHLQAGTTFQPHRRYHCFTHMFTILTNIWPFQPVYLLWFYIHATMRCSSGCYNRHSYYLTRFWCNTDNNHSFSQAALTCTLLLEQPSYTHIPFGIKVLVVTETKEDKFWYAALYYFLDIQQTGDFSVFWKSNIFVPTNAQITNRRVNSVQNFAAQR